MTTNYYARWLGRSHSLEKKTKNTFTMFLLLFTLLIGVNMNGQTTCDYTFDLTDSFGDGWNGAEIEVVEDGTVVETLGPQITAGFASVDVTLNQSSNVDVVFATSGAYDGEISLDVLDPDGNNVFSLAQGNLSNFNEGDVLFNFIVCPPVVCDHTLELIDDFGDGWNGNEIEVVEDGTVVKL